jgi:hypothetical protein
MGTTLTGTTPQDTYDSLIKVTDNGPLSGTAKYLSDGLGNDSVLALSTARVGVGTASPNQRLDIQGSEATAYAASSASLIAPAGGVNLNIQNTGAAGYSSIRFVSLNGSNAFGYLGFNNNTGSVGGSFVIGQRTGADAYSEQMRITEAGNVGIAKTSPSNALHIAKAASSVLLDGLKVERDPSTTTSAIFNAFGGAANIVSNSGVTSSFTAPIVFAVSDNTTTTEIARITSNGLTFNGDTAAANALDDYEEGTWTMGISFGGASAGVTVDSSTGTYTKIGRQVTVNGLIQLTSKGSSTGAAKITGLPFTIANTTGNYSAASLRLTNITFTNQFQGFGVINTTTIALEEVTILGAVTDLTDADFANNSAAIVSLTYFV